MKMKYAEREILILVICYFQTVHLKKKKHKLTKLISLCRYLFLIKILLLCYYNITQLPDLCIVAPIMKSNIHRRWSERRAREGRGKMSKTSRGTSYFVVKKKYPSSPKLHGRSLNLRILERVPLSRERSAGSSSGSRTEKKSSGR